MYIDDAVLQNGEKILFLLRQLYLQHGYAPYRMGKFEEYDFYAGHKDFLVSDQVITFTDPDGKLMALKPDVTLSIIKNSADAPGTLQKVFYNETVYRVAKGGDSFKEIMQVGVECLGPVGGQELCEVLSLALKSLQTVSTRSLLAVSDLTLLTRLIRKLELSADGQKQLLTCLAEKNAPQADGILAECRCRAADTLRQLLALHGSAAEVLPRLAELLEPEDRAAADEFFTVMERLIPQYPAECLQIDFSVISDANYYNGVVFQGFIRDLPQPVLSGGQYDRLMQKMGRHSGAVGFAVYTDTLERWEESPTADEYINVALPKGRLGERVYRLFAAAGYECPELLQPNRRLIFENAAEKVRYFWVKPSDVAIYVERGAADVGVAGKDILAEYTPDVYELADLKRGTCRMAVAAPEGFTPPADGVLRVATKFADVARDFYRSKGQEIDIIHLNGSIEIAPLLGLSDAIVDIVETGATLRENHLAVVEEIMPISARLIANKASYKFKGAAVDTMVRRLNACVEEDS